MKVMRDVIGYPTVCHICGEKIAEVKDAELDHVIPKAQGGENCPENLRWAHRTCNRMKHNLTMAEFIELAHKIIEHHAS